jgi:hypothetical protein
LSDIKSADKKNNPQINKKANPGLNINLDQIRLDSDSKFSANVNVNQPNIPTLNNITSNQQSSEITERSDKSTPKSSTRVPILRNFITLNSDDHYNKLLKN